MLPVPWSTVERESPALAESAAARFAASARHVLATMTVSGAPRVSGTTVEIRDGELLVPVVLRSPKGTDLLGDPRCVLHSNPGDGSMVGDVKITGVGVGVDLVGSDGEPRPHGREPVMVAVHVTSLELSVRDRATGEITVTRWDAAGAAGTGSVRTPAEGTAAPHQGAGPR